MKFYIISTQLFSYNPDNTQNVSLCPAVDKNAWKCILGVKCETIQIVHKSNIFQLTGKEVFQWAFARWDWITLFWNKTQAMSTEKKQYSGGTLNSGSVGAVVLAVVAAVVLAVANIEQLSEIRVDVAQLIQYVIKLPTYQRVHISLRVYM